MDATERRRAMIDVAELMANPGVESLTRVLEYERRLLEQLLYRHAETAMLLGAGQARFVPRALDELESVASELGSTEVIREAIVASLVNTDEAIDDLTLEVLVDRLEDGRRSRIAALLTDLRTLWAEVETVRSVGRDAAENRAQRVTYGLRGLADQTGYGLRGG
jgi:hypothetical protein